jgi:hypothetical protein
MFGGVYAQRVCFSRQVYSGVWVMEDTYAFGMISGFPLLHAGHHTIIHRGGLHDDAREWISLIGRLKHGRQAWFEICLEQKLQMVFVKSL